MVVHFVWMVSELDRLYQYKWQTYQRLRELNWTHGLLALVDGGRRKRKVIGQYRSTRH